LLANLVLSVALVAGCANSAARNEQFRLPAPYAFRFYDRHEAAARSFYAAHYAHFRVYEVALVEGERAMAAFDDTEREVLRLVNEPPKYEPPAELIAPQWSKIGYPTGRSMDWTHMLHSQLYDILSDDRVADRRVLGDRAIAYYLANGESAFSTRGYGHRWMMGGGAWAGLFAVRYPRINGVLWAYHWHHAAVYEALMEESPEARRAAVDRVIQTFTDSVLRDPPRTMPLSAEIAPRFSRMFPAAAHIFDNLHMMHDVTNDIMVDERLAREAKAFEIERMRRNMMYTAQSVVVAPGMPMGEGQHEHGGASGAMRVPTQLADGTWLPQGHPDARVATMDEMMMPLLPVPAEHVHRASVEKGDVR
jgi:hypothetical protein